MECPPGCHISNTQLQQRLHLTKIISDRTLEGPHDRRRGSPRRNATLTYPASRQLADMLAAERAQSKWAQMKADAAARREDITAKIDKRADQRDAKAAARDADWAELDASEPSTSPSTLSTTRSWPCSTRWMGACTPTNGPRSPACSSGSKRELARSGPINSVSNWPSSRQRVCDLNPGSVSASAGRGRAHLLRHSPQNLDLQGPNGAKIQCRQDQQALAIHTLRDPRRPAHTRREVSASRYPRRGFISAPDKTASQTGSRSKNTSMRSGGQSVARLVFLSMWATVMRQRETVFPAESTMARSMRASGPRNSRTNEVMVIS